MKNRPLTDRERLEWARMTHHLVIQGIARDKIVKPEAMAFHGGTSLHLSWRSPRYSEDLDFLVSSELRDDMDNVIRRVARFCRENLAMEDPAYKLEIKKRTSREGKLSDYQFRLSKTGVLGKVMTKIEFWMVAPDYLKDYEVALRTPQTTEGDLTATIYPEPIPAATLSSALTDKMVAFATRPFIKWRDVFDVWWLREQNDVPLLDSEQDALRFLRHLSEYRTIDDLPPDQALERFTQDLRAAEGPGKDNELKFWLPETVWENMRKDGFSTMVETACETAETLARVVRREGLAAMYMPGEPEQTQESIRRYE